MNHPNLGYSVKITFSKRFDCAGTSMIVYLHDVIGMVVLGETRTIVFQYSWGDSEPLYYRRGESVELERMN